MKLNKFLVAAAAVAVLPLSVASAADVQPELPEFKGGVNGEPLVQPALPEFKGGVNGEGTQSDAKYSVTADGVVYSKGDDQGRAAVHNVPEFKGGVNGAEPAVAEKPEYKAEEAQKPATPAKKVLPKTSAAK